MSLKIEEWDSSYRNRDNFVFFPHEEVVRFTSKFIRKRIGINEFRDVHCFPSNPKVLDLGCGIGRHVMFLADYGLDVWGIDLSGVAIEQARNLFAHEGQAHLTDKLVQGSIANMPFANNFFDFVVSHGVLDSMPFEVARKAMEETARCLKPGGMFYLDVISGDDNRFRPGFCGEEIVDTNHEHGTVQSYFNREKIGILIGDSFDMAEGALIRRTSLCEEGFHSRYHLILKNKIS